MTRNNKLGGVRRGQLLNSYGPGSIIDFLPENSGPISVIAGGLDYWNEFSKGTSNQKIFDRRLQKVLKKDYFRLPPVITEDTEKKQNTNDFNNIIGLRFPKILYCPECNIIQNSADFPNKSSGNPGKICVSCTNKTGRDIYVIPFRFIICCAKGHVDDFPLSSWFKEIKHIDGCEKKINQKMKLIQEGSLGLVGLKFQCNNEKCKQTVSLQGIFSEKTLRQRGIKCSGKSLWIKGEKEDCKEFPRVLQRGASNLYFPIKMSALSIPPWFDKLDKCLDQAFGDICETYEPEEITTETLKPYKPQLRRCGFDNFEEVVMQIKKRVAYIKDNKRENLLEDEYDEFTSNTDDELENIENYEFKKIEEKIDEDLKVFFDKVVKVVRLREVQVLTGFTRINPPTSNEDPNKCKISNNDLDWLPATEVRGEGIFLRFNKDKLLKWEKNKNILERSNTLNKVREEQWKNIYGKDSNPPENISPRFLLIHSFSHLLIRQLSFECGYSSSALKERLYVNDQNMCGLLIYTSTSDADGTLGGLSQQADSERLKKIIINAIENAEWCSGDPLCITSNEKIIDDNNISACHSCLLAPETSCQYYNKFLDRAMVVGYNDELNSIKGFFEELIK